MHVDRNYLSIFLPVFGVPDGRQINPRVGASQDAMNRERRDARARYEVRHEDTEAGNQEAEETSNTSTSPSSEHRLDIVV